MDSVLYDQKGGEAEGVLGYLVASDGSHKYEISDCYCIGRSVGSLSFIIFSQHLFSQRPAMLRYSGRERDLEAPRPRENGEGGGSVGVAE